MILLKEKKEDFVRQSSGDCSCFSHQFNLGLCGLSIEKVLEKEDFAFKFFLIGLIGSCFSFDSKFWNRL